MRIATPNVENFFERVAAMNLESWKDGRSMLNDYARFNRLIEQQSYSAATKKALLEVLERNKLSRSNETKYFLLRENRGRFYRKARNGESAEIIARGRSDWVGWLELKTAPGFVASTRSCCRPRGSMRTATRPSC